MNRRAKRTLLGGVFFFSSSFFLFYFFKRWKVKSLIYAGKERSFYPLAETVCDSDKPETTAVDRNRVPRSHKTVVTYTTTSELFLAVRFVTKKHAIELLYRYEGGFILDRRNIITVSVVPIGKIRYGAPNQHGSTVSLHPIPNSSNNPKVPQLRKPNL